MPDQTTNGYAFEYAVCINTPIAIRDWRNQHNLQTGSIRILQNTRFASLYQKWSLISNQKKDLMNKAALAGLRQILDMEPRLIYFTDEDPIQIVPNESITGRAGDVRDIIYIRNLRPQIRRVRSNESNGFHNNHWEIGISCKWNHWALKSPRLSNRIDFGEEWLGVPCSNQYWDDLEQPLHYLNSHRNQAWNELPENEKFQLVYRPFGNAFISELRKINETHGQIPISLLRYLLGRQDFYKLIGIESQRSTEIQVVNIDNTLNQPNQSINPRFRLPKIVLPTRIINIDWIPGSEHTIQVVMDNGWQINLRLHNAETRIKNSLKFDVNFAGNPIPSLINFWHDHE